MKKFFLSAAVVLFIISLFSCEVGLGEVVDLEAPSVTVSKMVSIKDAVTTTKTSFDTTIYTRKHVVFSGEASDNVGVTNVRADIKWLTDTDYTFFQNASISGNTWTLDISFPKEGACWFKITAEDKAGNYGNKSGRVITLFVDENGPVVGDAWYIDRLVNGIQYSFQSKENLEAIITADSGLTDPSNKDVAQNGEFLICGTLTDASGIDGSSTTLDIYEDGVKKAGGITWDQTVSSSKYAPKFRINSTYLAESGKHYYQIKYNAQDTVTDPEPNKTENQEIEMGYFLWWPEMDAPRCSISGVAADATSTNINTSDSLNITVFDDDALKQNSTVSCVLSGTTTVKKELTIDSSTQREANIILTAPSKPQTMTLTITAEDANGKTLNKSLTVLVTDDFSPTIIITSPENNQVPSVSGDNANISFGGITLDKAGCKYVEFVWVPDTITTSSAEKKAKAQAWLNSIATAGSHGTYAPTSDAVKVTSGTGDYAGLKMWSAKLTEEAAESSFEKHSFTFTASLLKDFTCNDVKEANKEKYFLGRVTREDGNYSETELKLVADNLAPEIVPVSPAGNLAVIDGTSDLTIKFRGEKSSGVQMDTLAYKIWYVDSKGNETDISDKYDSSEKVFKSEKITASTLAGYASNNINPKYKFYAKDVLGNDSYGTYQFIISSLPVINTVTSSASAKNKKGDEILINVSFTKPVSCTNTTTLKLKGIANSKTGITADTVVKAPYYSGSGSTTLVFKYTVQEGDTSEGLQVYNEGGFGGVGPIDGMDSSTVHVNQLNEDNNLQTKRASNPIKIDGISPNVTSVAVAGTGTDSSNTVSGVTYLKAGRTIKATIVTDKKVTVQGSPVFYLKTGTTKLPLTWQSISSDGKTLQFSAKVTSSTTNGAYVYETGDYLGSTEDVIKDEYGNTLVIPSASGTTSANITVDTNPTVAPVITNSSTNAALKAGKYKDSVTFTVSTVAGATTEYSTDGGSTWTTYSSAVTVTSDCSVTARITDYAGNVSDYASTVNLKIESTFPTYTVECTNSDGNYKYGSTLEFKVSFDRAVTIEAGSTASIALSGINSTDSVTSGAKATLKDTSAKTGDGVTEAVFTYTTQAGDDFYLKIAKDAVTLTGFKDLYGISQGSKVLEKGDYKRSGIHCDSVAPYVSSMVPAGTKTTQNGLNAYTNGKKIVLTFNENVSVVSGKIHLRQTSGWAIPPVLTADEFNTILSAAKSADIDTTETNGLTASQVLYMDGLEDGENLYSSLVGAANDRYHGTAQFVGPYKKMTNGINTDGTPNLDVKYVLDFGVDIWDSSNSTKKNFGLTFTPNWSPSGTKYTYITYHKVALVGWVNVLSGSDINESEITTDTIRYVLEQAHYHERYMAVNSTYVTVSGNTVTLNFPEGLLGDDNLPEGRQWELVIEKGAFMDESGNYFGSVKGVVDKTTDEFVLIKNGDNSSFMSAGVAAPAIRVNRYSYGLGMYQPTAVSGGNVTSEMITSSSTSSTTYTVGSETEKYKRQTGNTEPTAKVAVKIDCVTPGAYVRYSMNSASSSTVSTTANRTSGDVKSYATTTTASIPSSASTDSEASEVVFLAGSGNYKASGKDYITADAYASDSTSVTSDKSYEGVFQTVVNFNTPTNAGGKSLWAKDAGECIVNIHGTTGTGGEPTIVPYPLRDQPVSSAYMRQMYKSSTTGQYYWVSYEILTDGIFSMYSYGHAAGGNNIYATGNSKLWNDWAPYYGKMEVGEFIKCNGMIGYPLDY